MLSFIKGGQLPCVVSHKSGETPVLSHLEGERGADCLQRICQVRLVQQNCFQLPTLKAHIRHLYTGSPRLSTVHLSTVVFTLARCPCDRGWSQISRAGHCRYRYIFISPSIVLPFGCSICGEVVNVANRRASSYSTC